jgi:hypothetical protein
MRYPVFLLAFGPPLFRSGGVDVTQGKVDIWSFFQVGLLGAVALRAIIHLASAEFILIPQKIQSVIRYAFFLGLLFMISAIYSPSPSSTAAYAVFYMLTWVCVIEFVADTYRCPPDWVQCLFQFRWIALLQTCLVLLTLALAPQLVLGFAPGMGMRLNGGAVAPITTVCPVIAIISAYSFLHSLEPRFRAFVFFLAGLAGTLMTQMRGSEIGLFVSLLLLAAGWAKSGKRAVYLFISGLMACILFCAAILAVIGPERIWNRFNRGQSAAGIESASGRTEAWAFAIKYCTTHPWGMGYVVGFRVAFRQYFSLSTGQVLSRLGTAHNTFLDVLAGAGWLALAVYLIMMTKIIRLAWPFVGRHVSLDAAPGICSQHAVRCALVLLVFCFVYGMDTTEYSAPLRAGFYILYVIIAIILGASARLLVASRSRSR